ncbi:MAG: hypothetical protein INR73_22635 [Williamsia sp.]|nr:hypothetical protein [Williamsia sp.]
MNPTTRLTTSIRRWLLFFIIALAFSGITAFAVESELAWLIRIWPLGKGLLSSWLLHVYNAVQATNAQYPFISYGSDWLAFAHLVIAIAFIGPLRDPVRNKWIIRFGQIACLAIFPLAFIAGPIRHIPLFWQLIDCSFGAIGLIPLAICYHKINQLEKLTLKPQNSFQPA